MNPSRTDDPRRGIDAQVGEDRAGDLPLPESDSHFRGSIELTKVDRALQPFFYKRILVRSSATDPKRETPGGCFILVIPPALLPACALSGGQAHLRWES